MKRDDLERELVVKDRQALITEALKIYDVNTDLVLKLTKERAKRAAAEKAASGLQGQVNELTARNWIQVMVGAIRNRRDVIRARNELTKENRLNENYNTNRAQ